MSIPFIYPDGVLVDGKQFYDGAFSDPLPVDIPQLRKAHTITILTSRKDPGRAEDVFDRILAKKLNPAMRKAAEKKVSLTLKRLRDVEKLESESNIVIRPHKQFSRLVNTRSHVMKIIQQGHDDTVNHAGLQTMLRKLRVERPDLFHNNLQKKF
jgi:predicted patatin/cPLA2 family phospholipase